MIRFSASDGKRNHPADYLEGLEARKPLAVGGPG